MTATATNNEDWQARLASHGLIAAPSLKATEAVEVASSRVWEAIVRPGYLKDCHPFCAETVVESWPGVGSRDSITYYSGVRYQRHVVSWVEGVGYDIELGEIGKSTARVLWRVEPTSPESCEFSIEVIPLVRANLDDEKKQQYLARLFGQVLQDYLECVVKGVRFFATTGTPVSKDQFGWNPFYSS